MTSAPLLGKVVARAIFFVGILSLAACNSSEERAQSHYERGLELVTAGELVKADLEFRNALKLDSDHLEALFALGEVRERQGNFPGAFRIYASLAERSQENLPVRLKLAYFLLAANQLDEAQKYLDQASALDEDAPEVLVANASFQLRTGNLEQAESHARQALSVDPSNMDALAVLASAKMEGGDPEGALAYLDEVPPTKDGDFGLQILRLSALEAMGDQPRVEELFAKLVELNPGKKEFSEAWAKWYLSKNREADAERVLREFANANIEVDAAQLSLVSFLNSVRGADAAIAELKRVIDSRDSTSSGNFTLQLALADLLYSTGQSAEAIELMQTLVANTADQQSQSRAKTVLGAMYVQTGDWAAASEQANEVLDRDPKNVDALRLRASIKLNEGDNAGAVDDVLLALNEAPENAPLRAMLASAYERQGSSVLAEEQYGKALALDNNSASTGLPLVQFLMRHGKADKALRVLEQVREREPGNRRVLELLAQLKLATQDWAGAQAVADDLRKLEETDASRDADRIAAAALGGLNRHAESLKILEDTSVSDENRQEVLPDLIRAYVRAGKQDAAVAYLESLLEEQPDNSVAQVLLASVHLSQGRAEEAEEQLIEAASRDEGLFAQTSLAQFYIARNDTAAAEKTILAGLEKDDSSVALRLMLTSVLQQSERFDEAIAEYERMFKENPESTIVANDLASLLSERRSDEASLDRAFEIAQRFRNSEIPQYLDTLGWIYYLRGEYSSALPLLRTSAQKLPDIGLAQYHLGMVLAAAGQAEEAIASLENALAIATLMTESDVNLAKETIEKMKETSEIRSN